MQRTTYSAMEIGDTISAEDLGIEPESDTIRCAALKSDHEARKVEHDAIPVRTEDTLSVVYYTLQRTPDGWERIQ